MDGFIEKMLAESGLICDGRQSGEGTSRHRVDCQAQSALSHCRGGGAYLISKSIKAARLVAFEDLGMEAIHEFEAQDMPVIMAVDVEGNSIHNFGPLEWRRRMAADSIARSIGA
ncbi:MAG: hypothetical protein EOR01_28080 [Mesorhizobium sp.]|uniref:fumarate hydratase C-terminal domain-containing protein n=1 Tax=Mesorhizobium sp. TaxID=1871066 RepID=UPI000FE9A0AA|nr:fumarate hydratase C-terminal domain-containing protein [Mesorhizobium sp.]RWP16085.1 MAG: hypothetical protein EOR01_28080 [Mesorhizobium sp.]